MVAGRSIAATIPLLVLHPGGGHELVLRAPRRQHIVALSLFRPHPAEWVDSAVPAAGEGGRLLQHVPPAISGNAVYPARYRRAISSLGARAGRETQHSDRGGTKGPS